MENVLKHDIEKNPNLPINKQKMNFVSDAAMANCNYLCFTCEEFDNLLNAEQRRYIWQKELYKYPEQSEMVCISIDYDFDFNHCFVVLKTIDSPDTENAINKIKNLIDTSMLLEGGNLNIDDAAKIIAFVREHEKLSLDSMRRADIADSASKKILEGFEAWKKEHLCIPRSEIESELDDGGSITTLGKIIVLKHKK